MGQAKFLLLAIVLMLSAIVWSDEVDDNVRREQERQAAFRSGFSLIVDSLNQGSFDLVANSIDRNDFMARVFGLRLIDQRVKREFTEQMKFQLPNLIKSGFVNTKDGFKAVLLGIESRGDRGRAVVRLDLPELQFSYHEYELRLDAKNRVVVVDWTDYMQGERFTDGVGSGLVMAAPSKLAARKLVESKSVTDADMFQFGELLKAARDRDAERYVDIINKLTPELQRERIVVLTSVQLTKSARNRRLIRAALMQMAKYFPSDPLYSLMLLDYYVPTKKFDEALTALRATHVKLGFDDAAMEARLSAITLALGNVADASAHAKRALDLEPGLELAWWSALRARVAAEDYAGAVAALGKLEKDFGHTLGRAELERDKSFASLLASAVFGAWADGRQ
jgi:tetratricopeptide (TPR) repeat protein